MTDTLFADVSYFQAPVDDSYPYAVLSIRSNDGTFEDPNFAHNYNWCVQAVADGHLKFFIVYFYWRPGNGDVDTHIAAVEQLGGPHPHMVTMIDVESGGNPGGDHSDELNAEYARLVAWLDGNNKRVIAYANLYDERALWQFKPAALDWILAGYGANPQDSTITKLAHQYTDGQGYGDGLPEGCPPFGNCDMNSADGLNPDQFAAACGIGTPTTGDTLMALTDDEQAELLSKVRDVWDQLRGPDGQGWPQLGQNDQGQNLTLVDAIAAVKTVVETSSTHPGGEIMIQQPQLHNTPLTSSVERAHILSEDCWCNPTVEHVPGRKPAATSVTHAGAKS